jgi:hypothetical protein
MNPTRQHSCDICAAAGIETPSTQESRVLIKHWMGNAGSHTAYVCDECFAQLRPTALDGAIDEAAQDDF